MAYTVLATFKTALQDDCSRELLPQVLEDTKRRVQVLTTLVHRHQHSGTAAFVCPGLHEALSPHVVPVSGTQPNTGTVVDILHQGPFGGTLAGHAG